MDFCYQYLQIIYNYTHNLCHGKKVGSNMIKHHTYIIILTITGKRELGRPQGSLISCWDDHSLCNVTMAHWLITPCRWKRCRASSSNNWLKLQTKNRVGLLVFQSEMGVNCQMLSGIFQPKQGPSNMSICDYTGIIHTNNGAPDYIDSTLDTSTARGGR